MAKPAKDSVLLLCVVLAIGWTPRLGLAQSNCAQSNSSCAECIAAGPDCQWCSTPLLADCIPTSSSCPNVTDAVNPRSTLVSLDERSVEVGQSQVSVSSVRMKLRVNETQTFKVSVRAQENFPLDLYMLMDLSFTFRDDLVTVKRVAPDIVSAVRKLTSQFQVGFGTFVDKTTAPFSAPIALRLGFNESGQPSACSANLCSRPVSYEHVVNLTNSSDLFDQSVQNLIISTSSDVPEGTLDAMMQAVVCTEVVGWREEARKVLLVMTDDLMHTAGDGRLAGIYRPNDAKCHTQFDPGKNQTLYSDSLVYDYPTIEQMRMRLEQFGVVPVFAISGSQIVKKYFENIAETFAGFTEPLTPDAENLISVIEQAYNQLVDRASLNFSSLPAYLKVSIAADCPLDSNRTSDNGCSGIGNDIVNFTVNVTLTRCPDELRNSGKKNFTIFVRPAFGRFTVEVEGQCSCDCEQNPDINSSSCSGNGNLICGLCDCSEEWSGNDCSCSRAACPTTMRGECGGSSRGECVCGNCSCFQLSVPKGQTFFGNACQCDNSQCLQPNGPGIECSGRGTCECNGGCKCGTSSLTGLPHNGTYCECNTEDCISDGDPCRQNGTCTVCNGHGTCDPCRKECMQCESSFTGTYCQVNESAQLCMAASQACLVCYGEAAEQRLPNPAMLCPTLSCPNYIPLHNDPEPFEGYQINGTLENTTQRCPDFFDGIMCTYRFFGGFIDNGATVFHVLHRNCLPIPIWAIALIILFVLLILGILILIIVKLIYVWLDYREVRRLNLEVQNTKFTTFQSPLYHDPNVKYTNVNYGKEE